MSGEPPLPPEVPLEFPENVVEELATMLAEVTDVDVVIRRPLRPTDPNGSIGVYAIDWAPTDHAIGQFDPAVTRYKFAVQSFVKHGDDEVGVILHSQLAKRVRVMLYRDEELRVRLGSLSTDEDGVIERLLRWGVQTQRYLSNEVQGTFLYLAVTELWVDTEIV
jgi:hypothetical protein